MTIRRSRTAALLMLLLFTPLSVLNAAPLVWCVANSDHIAIEFGIGGSWHGADASAASRFARAATVVTSQADSHPDDCIDRDLTSPAVAVATHDHEISPPLLLPELGAREDRSSALRIWRMPRVGASPPQSRISWQLSQLRTVVLLN